MMTENVVLNGPNGTIKASFDIYAFSAFQRYHNYCDRISSFCNRPFFCKFGTVPMSCFFPKL